MATKNLQIELTPLEDKNGNTYYVGKLEGPFQIDCGDGVAFLIFTSEPGSEVLQITAAKEKDRERK